MRIVAFVLVALATTAHAENVTVGVFAPTAPFPTTGARVELASRLGEHLGKALGGTGTGRVYARAGDFAAAVKRGDVTVALVDATYLASAGGYSVIATSVRGGETAQAWQLVARGGPKIGELKGKRVLMPAIGGRETEFVVNVLLGGEVAKDYFGKVEVAADTASALSALGLGKADAAVVPAGIDLPGGVATVLVLPAIANPMLVAYGTVSAAQKQTLATAAASFKGDATVAAFRAGDGDGARAIARRFAVPVKRGPLAVPAVRLVVGDLVDGRTFTLERTPPTSYATKPK